MADKDDNYGHGQRLSSLETEVKYIREMLTSMNDKLDLWHQNFVPRHEIDERFKARDKQIKEVKDEVDKVKGNIQADQQTNKKTFPAWANVCIGIAMFVIGLVALLTGAK